MKNANRILAAVVTCISLFIFFWSSSFPETAAFWPKLFSIVLLFLTALMFIDTFLVPEREKGSVSPFAVLKNDGLKVGVSVVLTIVYLLLMVKIGFIIVTPFYLIGMCLFIGYREKKTVLLLGFVGTLVVFILFRKILNVPLHPGVLEDIMFFTSGGIL